LKEVNINTYLV